MSDQMTQKIVKSYRRTKTSLHGMRASEKRQRAYKITADRYNVPVSQVKKIVLAHDAENGISHAHPEAYTRHLIVEQQYKDAVAAFEANPQTHCDGCGISDASSLEDLYIRVPSVEGKAEEDIAWLREVRVRVLPGDLVGVFCLSCRYENDPL